MTGSGGNVINCSMYKMFLKKIVKRAQGHNFELFNLCDFTNLHCSV